MKYQGEFNMPPTCDILSWSVEDEMRLQYEVGFVEGFVESRMKFYEDVCEETR